MSLRQPKNKQLGKTGEGLVTVFFEKLGWGPISASDHDLGTDLFVQQRTENLAALPTLIAVQVKTGDSYFRKPTTVGGRKGWWFTEGSDEHGEYWRNHVTPHILVLQSGDLATQVWEFLDSSTIESTGKGIRVFVPEDQRLDPTHREAWVDRAFEVRKNISYEGSSWNFSLQDHPESDWARLSLLTPRLVAPHINQGQSGGLLWAEALAFCIEAHTERWQHHADQCDDVPTPVEAASSPEWGWRFAAAVHEFVTLGTIDQLEGLATSKILQSNRIAHAIVLATGLVSLDRLDEALDLLTAIATDDQLSADQGWLNVHRAWILSEKGEIEHAIRLVRLANIQLAASQRDATISAIQSAAAMLLFELAEDDRPEVAKLLPALDTAASWWRTQTVASGLEAAAKRNFKSWSQDRSITLGAADTAHNELFSASLIARLTGSPANWRAAVGLLSTVDLTAGIASRVQARDSLDGLRRAGETTSLALALRRLRADGPLVEIQAFMAAVVPDRMVRSSRDSDLVALENAGEYCSELQAAVWIDFLILKLETGARVFPRATETAFYPQTKILDALFGLAPHFSNIQRDRLVNYIVTLELPTSELLDSPLRRLASELIEDSDSTYSDLLSNRAQSLESRDWYYWLLVWLAGPEGPRSRSNLETELLAGKIEALYALRTTVNLTDNEARAVLVTCSAGLDNYQAEAKTNGMSIGGHDFGGLFTKTALQVLELEAWTPLVTFLANEQVPAGRKRTSCIVLAEAASDLPADIRRALKLVSANMLDNPGKASPTDLFGGLPEIGGAALQLYLELADDSAPDRSEVLARLLSGGEQTRIDACDYFSRHAGYEGTLLVMTREQNTAVSNRATLALARRVCDDPSVDDVYGTALVALVQTDSEDKAIRVVNGLRSVTPAPQHVRPILNELLKHPSIRIRNLANELLTASP